MANTPIEVLEKGWNFQKTMIPRADGHTGMYAPWWYGWAIIDAFMAGYQAGQAESSDLLADKAGVNAVLEPTEHVKEPV